MNRAPVGCRPLVHDPKVISESGVIRDLSEGSASMDSSHGFHFPQKSRRGHPSIAFRKGIMSVVNYHGDLAAF